MHKNSLSHIINNFRKLQTTQVEFSFVEIEFEYEIYLVSLAVIVSFIGAYNSMEISQNIRFINNKNSIIFFLITLSVTYSSICMWAPYLIFFNSMRFKETEIFLDIRLVIFAVLSAIVCNVCGYCISFLPFFDRTYNKFKFLISEKIFDGNFNPNKHNINNSKFKTFTFKRKPTQHLYMGSKMKSKSTFTKIHSQNFKNHLNHTITPHDETNNNNYDFNQNCAENFGNNFSDDLSNSHYSIENEGNENQDKNYINDENNNNNEIDSSNKNNNKNNSKEKNINEKNNNLYSKLKNDPAMNVFDISYLFLKSNLHKKELLYCFIGSLFIGLSFVIIHFLIIFSIKVKDSEINPNIPLEIFLGILSIISSNFLHFAFYKKNSLCLRFGLALSFTLCSSLINSVSLRFTSFMKIQCDQLIQNSCISEENYNFLNKIENDFDFKFLIILDDIINFLFILVILIPYISKEILHNNLKKSHKIIQYIRDYASLGEKELNVITEYYEFLKPIEFLEETEIKDKSIEIENIDNIEINEKYNNSNIINENEEEENYNSDGDGNENINENNNNKNNLTEINNGNKLSASSKMNNNFNDQIANPKNKSNANLNYNTNVQNYNSRDFDQNKFQSHSLKGGKNSKFNTNNEKKNIDNEK